MRVFFAFCGDIVSVSITPAGGEQVGTEEEEEAEHEGASPDARTRVRTLTKMGSLDMLFDD